MKTNANTPTAEMTDTEFMESDAAYRAATGHGTVEDAARVERIASAR